jgi:putative MATE family efflux protein
MVEEPRAPRRGPALARDWTRGSVLTNLLLLSWPMVVMESLWVISQIVDLLWVGRLGSQSMAGMGIANIVLNLVYAVDMGLVVGVRATIARHVGAGDLPGANHVAGQAVLLGLAWGALVTVSGAFLAGPVMRLFGADAAVASEGVAFLRVMLAGWVGFEVMVLGLYAIQASGDTITPMLIEGVMRVVHVTLCPFLVLGLWVFPHLGVRGAALSNVIAQSLGAAAVLWVLIAGRSRLRVRLKDCRFAPRIMWRLLRIGIPALVMNLQGALGATVLMRFIIPFGTMAVAAHSLAGRVEMFLSVPGIGLGSGAGVLVGQNLGAGRPERAERSAWLAVGFVQAFMLAGCTVIMLWAEHIVGLFSAEPGLVALGSAFLRIAAAGWVVVALSLVLQNCIAGAGDTMPNMVISLAAAWAVQLPVAFLLPRVTGLGIYGVRWAIVAATLVSSLAYVVYFRLGRWKLKPV